MEEKIIYSEWMKNAGEVHSKLLQINSKFVGRPSGGRPRDPEKEKALMEMDKARFERYIESGKIKIIDDYRWQWRIDFKP